MLQYAGKLLPKIRGDDIQLFGISFREAFSERLIVFLNNRKKISSDNNKVILR
jgi:hypothetical protein